MPTYCSLTNSLKPALPRHSITLVVLYKGIRPLLSQEKINGWWETPTLSHNKINSVVIVGGTCRRCVSLSPPNVYCTVGYTLPARDQCISNMPRCSCLAFAVVGVNRTLQGSILLYKRYTQYISNVYPPETTPNMGKTEQYSGHG